MSDEDADLPAAPGGTAEDLGQAALAAARRMARRGDPASGGSRPRRRRAGAARGGGYSGSGPDDRDPKAFGALVRDMVADRGWDGTVASAAVVGRWDTLVGREIAARCRPTSLLDGELVLTAESTAWATQIRLLVPTLLGRITDEFGAGVVRQIRVHGPTGPTWRKGPLRITGRGPRDTYG